MPSCLHTGPPRRSGKGRKPDTEEGSVHFGEGEGLEVAVGKGGSCGPGFIQRLFVL